MQFYQELETILQTASPKEKIRRFGVFYDAYKAQKVIPNQAAKPPVVFSCPSYAGFITVVQPKEVPKRTNLTTKKGQISLLHAIAHIEYSAIDLALDICYRFRQLPKEFYDDWLEVAEDEVRHFLMIEKLLQEVGGYYGCLSVHNSLFEASSKTAHALLERLAVVPRYLEANGLDATPAILQKLNHLPKSTVLEAVQSALEVILKEEVVHVQKGDKWFRYCCQKENKPVEIYLDIINKYYPLGFSKLKTLNTQARLKAGFTCSELQSMVQKDVCNG